MTSYYKKAGLHCLADINIYLCFGQYEPHHEKTCLCHM